MIHKLKCWPRFYEAIYEGKKTFEVRADDRGFEVGHFLLLQEWDEELECYTGRALARKVTYIARDAFGLPPGIVVMALGE